MLPYDSLFRSTPEKQGIASEALLDFVDALESRGCNPHSLMVLRHGTVIASGWWRPFSMEDRRYVYSLSKSFTSIAVGFAVSEGLLTIEDRITSFFTESLPQAISDNLAAMRVKDLLSMTGGYSFDTTIALLAPNTEDWIKALLELPVEHKPGTFFFYNSGGSYLLSAVVQKVTGMNLLEYLSPRLFDPLLIEDATWETCPRGISAGGWGLSLKTEDLAKFGQFLLQKGAWQGRQLLPAVWIELATAAHADNHTGREKENIDWQQGYGYQFWSCQHHAYRADGAAGQYVVVMPEQDAVVVLTSEVANMQPALDAIWEVLLPAFKDAPLPSDQEHARALRASLRSRALPIPRNMSKLQFKSIFRKFAIDLCENEHGLTHLSYEFEEVHWYYDSEHHTSVLSISNKDESARLECVHPYMQPRWHRSSVLLPGMQPTLLSVIVPKKPTKPLPVASIFWWEDEQTFKVRWQFLETPHHQDLTVHLKDETAAVELRSSLSEQNPDMWGLIQTFTGKITRHK